MLQGTKNKQMVCVDVDGWVMLPPDKSLSFCDSDSEEEEEEECLEYLQDDLCTAVTNNNLAQVEKLLQKISPQFQLKDKKTPLSQAIPPPPAEPKKDNNKGVRTKPDPEKIKTNLAIIKTLLKSNADPNVIIQDGNTVLHYAAEKYNTEVAKLLLEYQANPNIKNDAGKLPSDCGKKFHDSTLVSLLEPTQKSLDRQLLAAVRTKNMDKTQELLKQNANPNIRDQMGRGPLTRAIMNKDKEMVELLIQSNANVNTGDDYQPLHAAVMIKDQEKGKEIVDILIKNKANITQQPVFTKSNEGEQIAPTTALPNDHKESALRKEVNEDGLIASIIALCNGHKSIAFQLEYQLHQQNLKRISLLHQAVKEKDIPLITALIKRGVDVNAKDAQNNTALNIGQKQGNPEIITLLQKATSEKSAIQKQNQLVRNHLLRDAALQNNYHLVHTLIKMGADINDIDKKITGNTTLHYAIYANNPELVSLLLQNKADITIKNSDGYTALDIAQNIAQQINSHIAQKSNDGQANESVIKQQTKNLEIINLLAPSPGNPNEPVQKFVEKERPDEYKEESAVIREEEATFTAKKAQNKNIIAIKAAAKTEEKLAPHLETLQKAITAKQQMHQEQIMGQNINDSKLITDSIIALAKSTENNTALNNLLIIATTQADVDTTKSLLKNELVDKDFGDEKKFTALHYAAIQGDIDKVKALIESGAYINIKNEYGNTPLHAAVILNKTGVDKTEVIKLLLEKGADINAQDTYGNTAAHFAAEAGDQATIELLQARGADFTIKDKEGLTSLDRAIKHAKETIDNIDFTAQEQETVWTQDRQYNLTPVITRQKEDSKQKLPNLIEIIKQLESKEGEPKFDAEQINQVLKAINQWNCDEPNSTEGSKILGLWNNLIGEGAQDGVNNNPEAPIDKLLGTQCQLYSSFD